MMSPCRLCFAMGSIHRGLLRRRYIVMTAGAAVALATLAIFGAWDRTLAVYYAVATVIAFAVLRLVAFALMRCPPDCRGPGVPYGAWRSATSIVRRLDALGRAVAGFGLRFWRRSPSSRETFAASWRGSAGETPSFFFVDIQGTVAQGFEDFLHQHAAQAKIERVR